MKRLDGKAYIIAEIGGNHEGDFNKAKELTVLAANSGADAVKFQVYTGSSLVNVKEDPDRVKHFDRFALPIEQYLELADLCNELDIEFLASVWDESVVDVFSEQMSFYKIGSGDLTAFPILKLTAMLNKPILLSTGLATLDEVKETVDFLKACNSYYEQEGAIGILQCTSMYPIPDEDANLQVMNTLREHFPGAVIGYSDHTVGLKAAEFALVMGAEILELHFTDKKEGREFRDHQVSFTCDDIQELRLKEEQFLALRGDGNKRPMKSEIDSGHVQSFRRALYFRNDFAAGHKISESDLIALRPCNGLAANNLSEIIGKKLKQPVKKLDQINTDILSN